MLSDTSYLVRGYATLTIADILANISEGQFSGEVVQLFKNNEATEQSDWVKIAIYRSLVMLGENEYFIPFINMLHSSDYRNRIFVLNIIDDIPNHKKEILNHLMKQQRGEYKYEDAYIRLNLLAILNSLMVLFKESICPGVKVLISSTILRSISGFWLSEAKNSSGVISKYLQIYRKPSIEGRFCLFSICVIYPSFCPIDKLIFRAEIFFCERSCCTLAAIKSS